ncbi:MAG TPA: antibiotic biosynthesis monooxygenase family protein [Acidimicrobiales bacterium]|jgi:heme-degrading monooxygenase HmoA|nr:antibiotic biosynthesis monooxygenase family protein [Acidimicrobiales bacterium]
MADRQCTVIVSYEVAHEDATRFLDSWEKANAFLKGQPGFVSNTMHRAVSAAPDFRFVNVSTWESDDAFRTATQNQDFHDASGRLAPFPVHAAAYEVVAR